MLWTLDDASHDPVRIKCPIADATFGWNPKGDRIAVARRCRFADDTLNANEAQIMELLRPAESAPRGIRVHGVCGRPSWSPDGRRIAMVRPAITAAPDIVVIDVMTGNVVSVAHGRSPAWSPTGDWLGYVALEREEVDAQTGAQEIRRVSSDGQRDERIRYVSGYFASNSGPIRVRVDRLVWAPDARAIALDVGNDIWIVSATDSTLRPIVLH